MNKKELLARLEALEQRKLLVFNLVYDDGHTASTTDIKAVLEAICEVPWNGLVSVDWPGQDRNNLFSAMIGGMNDCGGLHRDQ